MTPLFILWGLPGYVAYHLLQSVKPARTKSGWDFVMEVGLLSMACFIISRLLIETETVLFPALASTARDAWPRQYSFTLALGIFPVAEVVGVMLGLTSRRRSSWMTWYHRRVTGRDRNFLYADVFFAMCDELLSHLVLITLTSGKVYVGVLIAATQDPNETKRFLRFIPILSGYRREDDQQVTYTTFYEPTQEVERSFLVPADQLTVLARFDWERFHHFVNSGNVRLEHPTR
ncbi:MAG TPA: hypothetical protein VGF28_23725 [Thermoanaerobaculia bacterium]